MAFGKNDCDCDCRDSCCCYDSGDGDYPFVFCDVVLSPSASAPFPCSGTPTPDIATYPDSGYDYLNLGVFGSPSPPDPVAMPVSSTSVMGAGITIASNGNVDACLVGTDYSADLAGVTGVCDGVCFFKDTATRYTLTFDDARRVCVVVFHIGDGAFTPIGGPYSSITVTVTDNDGHTATVTKDAKTVIYQPFSYDNSAVVCAAYQGRSITEIEVVWNNAISGADPAVHYTGGAALGTICMCTQPWAY